MTMYYRNMNLNNVGRLDMCFTSVRRWTLVCLAKYKINRIYRSQRDNASHRAPFSVYFCATSLY